MQKDNKIQICESLLNIILKELGDIEYKEYIQSNSILKKYDNYMSEYEEKDIPCELLEKVHIILKEKIKSL